MYSRRRLCFRAAKPDYVGPAWARAGLCDGAAPLAHKGFTVEGGQPSVTQALCIKAGCSGKQNSTVQEVVPS